MADYNDALTAAPAPAETQTGEQSQQTLFDPMDVLNEGNPIVERLHERESQKQAAPDPHEQLRSMLDGEFDLDEDTAGQIEGEASAEVSSPAEGEQAAAEGEAPAGAEGESATEAAPAPEIPEWLTEHLIEGAVVETPEQAAQHVAAYRKAFDDQQALTEYLQEDTALLTYLRRVNEGVSPRSAAIEAFGEMVEDADDDLDEDAIRASERRRLEAEQRKANEKGQQRRKSALQEDIERGYKDVAEALKDDGASEEALRDLFEKATIGYDPITQRSTVRSTLRLLYLGSVYETKMAEATEKARKEGFEEGAKSVLKGRGAPAQPHLGSRGSRSDDTTLTKNQKDARGLQRSFAPKPTYLDAIGATIRK